MRQYGCGKAEWHRLECKGQRARRQLQMSISAAAIKAKLALFNAKRVLQRRRLLRFIFRLWSTPTGQNWWSGRGERPGEVGEPLWLLFLQTIEGEFVSVMSDMAKVHEPVWQAANATLSQAGDFLTRKIQAQERACTNRPNVLMWHQKPSITAHLVSMASNESSWLCKHRISDQTCWGTGARRV